MFWLNFHINLHATWTSKLYNLKAFLPICTGEYPSLCGAWPASIGSPSFHPVRLQATFGPQGKLIELYLTRISNDSSSFWFSHYIYTILCSSFATIWSVHPLQGTLQHFQLVEDSGNGLRWWSVGEHFVPDKCWSSLSRSQAAPSWLNPYCGKSWQIWTLAVTRWIVLQCPHRVNSWYHLYKTHRRMMTWVCAMYIHVYTVIVRESAKYYPVRCTQTISGLALVSSLLARLTILCRGTCKSVLNSGHHWPVVFQTFLAVYAT